MPTLIGPGAPVQPDRPQQRYSDGNRPLGSRAVLKGRQMMWAGPGWGWQSVNSYTRLKREGKLNRSFWSNPLGAIGNELKYFGGQVVETDRRAAAGRRPMGAPERVARAALGAINPVAGMLLNPPRSQTVRNVAAGLTIGAAENAAKLAIAIKQASSSQPSNPESSRAGNAIERSVELLYRAAGATPPSQQNQFERGLDATARSTGTAVAGTVAATLAVPAMGSGLAGAAITGGARWAVGEVISTMADDNRGGNIANLGEAAGVKLPLAVDVGNDDWITAGFKSLIPNALPGVALSGVGEALSKFSNTRRFLASTRKVGEQSDARARLQQAGITETDPATEATTFRQAEAEAQERIDSWIGAGDQAQPQPQSAFGALQPENVPTTPARPAADAQPPARPAADMSWPPQPAADAQPPARPAADAPPWARPADMPAAPEAQGNLQLDAQPPAGGAAQDRPPWAESPKTDAPAAGGAMEVEDIEIDPAELIYDPALPEADVVLNLLRDVDDADLQRLAQPGAPVVEQLDQILEAQRAAPVRPELEQGNVFAPAGNVAERIGGDGQPMPYAATLEAMPMDTLRSVAAPENNADLARTISEITGREWEEFTKADIIEGLVRYQEDGGGSLLVRDWNQGMRPTAEIAADPQRFQFKQGVNEQGEQLGNSLAGVNRWDTNAEGVLDVWTDPADGRTYVVNGHNRLARAQELRIPTVPVRELPAATAQEARAMGALSNIQAGQGTVFDAAKFMRDSGITSPEQLQQLGVPMSSGNAARGLALSQLPDNIFQAAVEGRLSVGKAAALGGAGLDEQGMQAAFKSLGGRDMSDAKFAEVVEQVRNTPRVVVDDGQGKLPWLEEEPLLLMEQKADLVVKIRNDLLKDKRFFSTAARGADRLESAGNKINVEGNKAIAADAGQVLGMFDQLKYAPGPVSDLLNDGARQIAEGAKAKVVADRIREQVAEAVRNALDEQGLPAQRPAGAAAGAQPETTARAATAYDTHNLWRMDETELRAMRQAVSGSEDADLIAVLGEEGAQEFKRLDRMLNSSNAKRSQAAQQELDKLLRDITPEQERLIYGIGSQDVSAEDIDILIKAHEDIGTLDPGYMAMLAARNMDAEALSRINQGIPSIKDQAALIRMQAARQQFAEAGIPPSQIPTEMVRGLVETGYANINDAAELAQNFADALQKQGLPTQRPAGAAAPEPAAAPSQATEDTDALFAEADALLAGMQGNTGRMAEGARRMLEISAGIEDINGGRVTDQVVPSPRLTPEQRAALQLDVIRNAVDNAEVRPPETLLPELPDGPAVRPDVALADLEAQGGRPQPGTPAAQAMADEFRLAAEFAERDAQMRAIAEEGLKDATGYELKTFEEKKALGMADGHDPDPPATEVSSAPQGWESFDTTSKSSRGIAADKQLVEEIVRKVAGDDVTLRFNDAYIKIATPKAWGGDGVATGQQAGFYRFVDDLIQINGLGAAGSIDLIEASFHESFHRIQFMALGSKEMKALDSVFARVKVDLGARIDGIAYLESQAIAFQRYARARFLGEDPIAALVGADFFQLGRPRTKLEKAATKIISSFDKIADFVEKFVNFAKGNGFASVKSIFEQAYEGSLRSELPLDGAIDPSRLAQIQAWLKPTSTMEPVGRSNPPRAQGQVDSILDAGKADSELLPAPVRPEPMQLADSPDPPTKPRTKKADQTARAEIEANNQRMDEIRRKAQQEGC